MFKQTIKLRKWRAHSFQRHPERIVFFFNFFNKFRKYAFILGNESFSIYVKFHDTLCSLSLGGKVKIF